MLSDKNEPYSVEPTVAVLFYLFLRNDSNTWYTAVHDMPLLSYYVVDTYNAPAQTSDQQT